MQWFRNLKKWQKGCILGLFISIILVFLVHYLADWTRELYGLFPYRTRGMIAFSYFQAIFEYLNAWTLYSHYILAELFWLDNVPFLAISQEHYIFASVVVIFYGGFGALMGRVQQIVRPARKWALTGLLIFFLLLFYALNILGFIMAAVASAIIQ